MNFVNQLHTQNKIHFGLGSCLWRSRLISLLCLTLNCFTWWLPQPNDWNVFVNFYFFGKHSRLPAILQYFKHSLLLNKATFGLSTDNLFISISKMTTFRYILVPSSILQWIKCLRCVFLMHKRYNNLESCLSVLFNFFSSLFTLHNQNV